MAHDRDNFWYPDKAKEEAQKTKMEHWTPPEHRSWQPPPAKVTGKPPKPQRPQKTLKVPKVKEPHEEKNGKKTSAPPPSGAVSALTNILTTVSGRIGGVLAKGKAMQAKMRANKVAPIQTKVQARHLELEPLCCLSSCLVRGGCAAVVAFEAFYVIATLLIVIGGMSRGGFTLWEPLPNSFNESFGHHFFYYCICVYDAVLLCFLIALARGLVTFSKVLVRAHYLFCYVSLIVNVIFLAFSVWALSSPGPFTWTPTNCLLVFCFAMQIPLQLWALTVVKSCGDFFALIHVFVALAEA
ncbi:hypothetical protein Y032_0001g69 [Ancylostoma ceylanicum]|uniref:Uncharacterized protein n=1 Tax=Ancylostoma ceylanicum TaxID=53326 RepID=A0A016W4S4_9BILA|nr:hypothetical protein Y032_0001g69 [Ancylostoma ceylanicum]